MQGYSVDGHESLGLSFDCDNDNFDELVCTASGDLTVGDVTYTGTDGANGECLRTDGLGGTFFDTCASGSGGSADSVAYHKITPPLTSHGIGFSTFTNTWTSAASATDFFTILGTSNAASLLHLNGDANTTRMIMDADAGTPRIFSFRTDDVARWAFRVDGAETGSNVGGDLHVRRYDDAGTLLGTPMAFVRSNGRVGIGTTAPNEQLEITENLRLPASTATTGIYYAGGNRFIHNIGTDSLSIGTNATQLNSTSIARTTVGGAQAYSTSGATGDDITAFGYQACNAITSADETTCIGSLSGASSLGAQNTFLGYNARASGTSETPTIAIGHNAICHGQSICVGKDATSTAANQVIIGGSDSTGQINDVYFGRGVTAANPPANVTLNPTGRVGTDATGTHLYIAGGKATGNAAGGDISFRTSDAGVSGSTLQTLSEKWQVDAGGDFLPGTTNTRSVGSAGNRVESLFLHNNGGYSIEWPDTVELGASADHYLKVGGAFGANSSSFTLWFDQLKTTVDAGNNILGIYQGVANATADVTSNNRVVITNDINGASLEDYFYLGASGAIAPSPGINFLHTNSSAPPTALNMGFINESGGARFIFRPTFGDVMPRVISPGSSGISITFGKETQTTRDSLFQFEYPTGMIFRNAATLSSMAHFSGSTAVNPGTGASDIISNVTISAPTFVTNTPNTATNLYIPEAPTGGTGNYAMFIDGGVLRADDGALFNNDQGATNDFIVRGDTLSNLFYIDYSADKIGIGTSTPTHSLDIVGGIDADHWHGSATDNSGINFNTFTNTWTSTDGGSGTFFRIDTPSTDITVTKNGNVGIGTTAPAHQFEFTNTWTHSTAGVFFPRCVSSDPCTIALKTGQFANCNTGEPCYCDNNGNGISSVDGTNCF